MNTEVFLSKTLGNEGYYCLFASRTAEGRRVQKFYDSLGDLVDAAYKYDEDGFDSYFALSTFNESNSRKVDNVKHLKSFFLDLDCGVGKEYPDQAEALDALNDFCVAQKLPRPMLVNSGRGVHAYWFLTESVTLDEWLPVAERLKKQCVVHGLLADPSVTADAARVLRVPKTRNHKTNPPCKVDYFAASAPDPIDFAEFSDMVGGPVILAPKSASSNANAVMQTLMGNTEASFKDIIAKTMNGKGCEQLRTIWKDQENCSEPMWRAGLSIAKFCSDSEVAARNISKNHEGYNVEDTAAKMDGIKGPYLCTSFDEFNPDVCGDCPNWGKVKSPITLGNKVLRAAPSDNVVEAPALHLPNNPTNVYTIPEYPKPYFRGQNGGVYVRSRNEDGDMDETPIYHNDLYVVKRILDAEIGEAVVMRLHLPRDGVREFTVPLTAVTSREEFRKQMAMQGVAVTKMDDLMNYTTTWVNELQANSTADEARRQFGWADDTHSAFVLGNQEITPTETKFNPPSTTTASLMHMFEPKGTLEEWKTMANFYNRDGFEMHQYIVGTAFGSPLMAFSPIACAGFHIHSKESGVGKTTAMFVGASVWAEPQSMVLSEDDSQASRMNRGEVYHNLPLYLDEMTNAKGEDLSNLIYQISSGKQRNRMSGGSNAERLRGKPWSLLAVSTGNTSIIERVSMVKNMPKAEAQRMMETKAVKLFSDPETKALTDEHAKRATTVYAHAGPIYIKYIMENLQQVKALLANVQRRIDTAAGLTAENRFWSAGAAATVTGTIIANKLGLIDYDTKKLMAYVVRLLKENKNGVNDMNSSVTDTLNDYIHENWGSILKIKSTDDLRKQNDNGLDNLVIPELDPKIRLVGRYETDIKRVYLIPKPLKAWCGRQQINYGSFVQDLKDKFGGKTVKMRLTKGTPTQLPPTTVISVDCSKVGLES
tara:strand:- start:218 stop:3019 length:2802 start_codon:yes stop_codon:yes gene_type:complete